MFVSHYTGLYGANRSMLNLICGLKQQGITDISVIIPAKGAICKELQNMHIAFYLIPFVNESYDYTKPPSYLKMLAKKYYNLLLVERHKHQFKKNKNVIVHTNTSVTFFGAYLAHNLSAPHVWHIREFGKADYNFNYNFGDKYFFKWINNASAVICISNALFKYRIKENIKPLCKVIYNGIISENAVPDHIELRSKNKIFRFGISGHISESKNLEEAIRACKLVNENITCELWIAGTGDKSFTQKLNSLITELSLGERIQFTGFIQNISKFYDSVDCVLMCSKNEALGRVTIEAMSKGLPVIGFNNAGTAEIITDGYNGLLYSGGYIQLAEKMKEVITNYERLIPMRNQALETVRESFTTEKYTDAVIDIYKQVVERAS